MSCVDIQGTMLVSSSVLLILTLTSGAWAAGCIQQPREIMLGYPMTSGSSDKRCDWPLKQPGNAGGSRVVRVEQGATTLKKPSMDEEDGIQLALYISPVEEFKSDYYNEAEQEPSQSSDDDLPSPNHPGEVQSPAEDSDKEEYEQDDYDDEEQETSESDDDDLQSPLKVGILPGNVKSPVEDSKEEEYYSEDNPYPGGGQSNGGSLVDRPAIPPYDFESQTDLIITTVNSEAGHDTGKVLYLSLGVFTCYLFSKLMV